MKNSYFKLSEMSFYRNNFSVFICCSIVRSNSCGICHHWLELHWCVLNNTLIAIKTLSDFILISCWPNSWLGAISITDRDYLIVNISTRCQLIVVLWAALTCGCTTKNVLIVNLEMRILIHTASRWYNSLGSS